MATPAQVQEQLRQTQQGVREEVDSVLEKLTATPIAQRGSELIDEATQRLGEVADSAGQQAERVQEAAKQAAGRVRGRPLVLALAGVGIAAGVVASVLLVRRRRQGGSDHGVAAPAPAVEGDLDPDSAD